MTMPTEADPGKLLDPLGRMNYSQDCIVAGHPARLAMNESTVYLAIADDSRTVRSASFAEVGVTGAGLIRSVDFAGDRHDIDFGSDDQGRTVQPASSGSGTR